MNPTRAFFTFTAFRFSPPLLGRQHLLHRLGIVGPQPHGRRHRRRVTPRPGPGPQRPPPHVRQHPGQRRALGRLRPAGEAAHDDAVAAGAGRGAAEAAAEGGLFLVADAGIWRVFNSHLRSSGGHCVQLLTSCRRREGRGEGLTRHQGGQDKNRSASRGGRSHCTDFWRKGRPLSALWLSATYPIPVVIFQSLSETVRYSFSKTNPIELATLDKKIIL